MDLEVQLSLHVETTRENASFSIQDYLSSAPWSALLMKYTSLWIPESSLTKAELTADGDTAK